jgi:acylphosphatase
MSKSAKVRQVVFYSGHVQGVGFRYTTREVALGFAVNGYVRNLPDGRVELVVEGSAAEVDAFLQAVRAQLEERIAYVDRHDQAATGEFQGFTVRG